MLLLRKFIKVLHTLNVTSLNLEDKDHDTYLRGLTNHSWMGSKTCRVLIHRAWHTEGCQNVRKQSYNMERECLALVPIHSAGRDNKISSSKLCIPMGEKREKNTEPP